MNQCVLCLHRNVFFLVTFKRSDCDSGDFSGDPKRQLGLREQSLGALLSTWNKESGLIFWEKSCNGQNLKWRCSSATGHYVAPLQPLLLCIIVTYTNVYTVKFVYFREKNDSRSHFIQRKLYKDKQNSAILWPGQATPLFESFDSW